MRLRDTCFIEGGVNGAVRRERRTSRIRGGQQPETDEAVPRIEFDFADLGREEDQVFPKFSLNAVDVGSESLSATLCPTKAFSEYLVETILAFVEALGHNVVMLHSDQELVLVQLLKAEKSRRVKRTLVRHGPRASHQSQDKIENANRWCLSCDVAVTRESLARKNCRATAS